MNTSNLGVYVGWKSTSEIFTRPYLTNDLALRPCFRIFIGLTYISLCSPTRYAHTRAAWLPLACARRQLFYWDKGARAALVALKLFHGYQGAIQTDGHPLYEQLNGKKGVILLGCLAHARRKFEESLKTRITRFGRNPTCIRRRTSD